MSVGRVRVLASGLLGLLACLEPTQWVLPSPSSGTRSVAIYLESEAGPNVLLAEPNDIPQAYSVVGRPTLIVYSSRTLAELGAPRLLATSLRSACDRQRPLAVNDVEAYRGSPELGWEPTSTLTELEAFSLPPIDLAECLKRGCVRRDERRLYYCEAGCVAPEAPEPPSRAACPEGWLDESLSSASCVPPASRSCAVPPCWIFPAEQGEACEPRVQPADAELYQAAVLPARVDRPLWLPRGRYVGTTEVLPGGALLGECHTGTSIGGKVILHAGGRLSDLSLEVEAGSNGVEIYGAGALVERVRIQGGEFGVVLTPGSRAELRSLHVQDANWGLTAQSSQLELHHYYSTGCAAEGLSIESSTGTIADAVVASTTDYTGVGISRRDGEPSPPALRLERLYVEGRHQIQVLLDCEVNGTDLRSDGKGTAGIGIQTSRAGTILELERVFISDIREDALWSRAGADPRIRDFLVRRSGGGLLSSTALQLSRGRFEEVGAEAIKVNGDGVVELRDLAVLAAKIGARFTPDAFEDHSVRLSRARIEGCEVGLVRGPGQVELLDVQVKEAMVGVQAEACWIDEALSGVSMEEVATPAVIEAP